MLSLILRNISSFFFVVFLIKKIICLGFERRESSSPSSDWNKPVSSNNSAANGWSNFQQPQTLNNPSRSNPNSNQWPEMNNFYGANTSNNTFSLPQQNNDNNR